MFFAEMGNPNSFPVKQYTVWERQLEAYIQCQESHD